jgi:pimeloyl-ACP methyl ester carboxylesterase
VDARFERKDAVVGGRPMFYRESAASARLDARDGPEVVLVHGLGLSGRYMLPTAAQLADRYPVFLPDLPGFGDSSAPAGVLDVAELADALAEWIDVVGMKRPALLGNSFGCQIIVDLAARHGDLIDRAILQGPTAPAEERTWFRQAVRWRQNQPFNPPSLGPVTWGDYRKSGWRRLFQTFTTRCATRSRPSSRRSPARPWWCAASWIPFAADRGPRRSPAACRAGSSPRSRASPTRSSTPLRSSWPRRPGRSWTRRAHLT